VPWTIKHGSGPRPWKIVRKDTGEVVGSSETKQNAIGSLAHRNDAYIREPIRKKLASMSRRKKLKFGGLK
jgi:hypothetical protein